MNLARKRSSNRSVVFRALIRFILAFLIIFSVLGLSTALAAPPLPPNLISPEPGLRTTGENYPPLGNPIFVWEPVEGASKYQIQVSRSAGFGIVEHEATTAATSYVPPTSLADGVYYWHVRSFAGREWGVYSQARSFTKDWCSQGELRPRLQSPLDGAIRENFAYPDFTWSAVPGAATYFFEINDNPSFIGAPGYSATALKTTHTPLSKLGNNTYYWRVTPFDAQGNSGTPSDAFRFIMQWERAPTLLEPQDGIQPAFTPTFSWVAMPGVNYYLLEISSDRDFSTGNVTTYNAKNTTYTPIEPLGNDQDYYWRVRAVDSAGNNSPYSEVRSFTMCWHYAPRLLTPVNNQINLNSPVFSWTPVPGAKCYQFQCDETSSFAEPLKADEIVYTNFFAHGNWGSLAAFPVTYYWRVRALDDARNATPWSEVRAFWLDALVAPNPVYPLYYYEPQSELTPVHGNATIAYPLFVWDTTHDATGEAPYPSADYYHLAVDDNPLFTSINFEITTASQGAAPTTEHPFTDLQDGRIYYWRIQAFRNGQPMGTANVWQTRIDTSLPQIPATQRIAIMYPANGHEVVEHAPILGWQPVTGASRYHLQVALDPGFTEIVDEAHPTFINYVPYQGRTQRLPIGTYYWRVRPELPPGDWSETRHFHVSHHLQTGLPRYDYVLPTPISADPHNLNNVAADPDDNQGAFELTGLYAALDRTAQKLDWVIAIDVAPQTDSGLYYGFYFDVDHLEGSGGNSDPLGKEITVPAICRPEYVLYVRRTVEASFDQAYFWEWSNLGWGVQRSLRDIGGALQYYTATHVLELRIPDTALTTRANWPGSVALVVFTTSEAATGYHDSVPTNGANSLRRFAFISDMLNPIYPFDTPLSNPIIHYVIPPMRWLMPSWCSVDGYYVQVARDMAFTDIIDEWEVYESQVYPIYGPMPNAFVPIEIAYQDNETYYWRVRVRHERYTTKPTEFHYGPWSKPFRFKLDSRVPTNLRATPTDSTPTFSWDRVEGVGAYRLQVDNDANFSSPLINIDTSGTQYTPLEGSRQDAMRDGNYYWRVAIKRTEDNYGKWTRVLSFTKTSVSPLPEAPLPGQVVNGLPTFRWREVLSPAGTPYISTPRYKLTVANNPNMDNPSFYITSATSFTPVRGQRFPDGNWYWRVSILDRNGIEGTASPIQSFYKEYLLPVMTRPRPGEYSPTTPTFQWTPVEGAAFYKVQIDDNPGFSHVRSPISTDNTSYTPIFDLTGIHVFYWRVWMVDADRVEGPRGEGIVDPFAYKRRFPLMLKGSSP